MLIYCISGRAGSGLAPGPPPKPGQTRQKPNLVRPGPWPPRPTHHPGAPKPKPSRSGPGPSLRAAKNRAQELSCSNM